MRQLLLLNLDGSTYGVWEDNVRTITDARAIHRLPLSPACIAGISVIDDRTVTLADLGVCIGLRGISHQKQNHILFISNAEQEKPAAFLVEGSIGKTAIPSDAVLPMPDYLKTPEIGTCAVHDSKPIPVINITALHHQIYQTDFEPSAPDFPVPAAHQSDPAALASVRVFECGGESFCAPPESVDERAVKSGTIAGLSLNPPYVKGIVFQKGKILPVISLARLMKLPKSGGEGMMLSTDISGEGFGLLIDNDEGVFPVRGGAVRALPPLVVSAWLKTAVLSKGDILPLIEPALLLSYRPGDTGEKPLPERYSARSRFLSVFGSEEVDVVEFSLLGARHALPKSEVEDVIPFKPYRPLPNVQPIVIGVVEHAGELLPVLDLAMCFGRRSLVTPEWRMILVRNGDFRALVITEAVFAGRRLTPDMHRAVPIALPHSIVYGCYPDGAVVKLILNVEALAVYFHKILVKEFLGALSKEMEQAPAELVRSLLPEEFAEEKDMAAGPVEGAEGAETAARVEAMERARAGAGARARSEADERAQREAEERARRGAEERAKAEEAERVRREAEERARSETERIRREAEERARNEAEERERAEADTKARLEAEARERLEAEERARKEAEERARAEAGERARRDAEERAKAEDAQRLQRESEERARRDAEEAERARREAEERARIEAEARSREEAEGRAREEAAERAKAEERKTREDADAAIREAEEISRAKAGAAVPSEEPSLTSPEPSQAIHEASAEAREAEQDRFEKWKKAGIPLGIITVLLLALLFLFPLRKTEVGTEEEKIPAGITTDAQKRETPSRKPEPKEPLVLTVPPDLPLETEVYIVKKGDTLWAICKRFTGNPLNYPRVASDNKIANPDLIFPDQKIHLKK